MRGEREKRRVDSNADAWGWTRYLGGQAACLEVGSQIGTKRLPDESGVKRRNE